MLFVVFLIYLRSRMFKLSLAVNISIKLGLYFTLFLREIDFCWPLKLKFTCFFQHIDSILLILESFLTLPILFLSHFTTSLLLNFLPHNRVIIFYCILFFSYAKSYIFIPAKRNLFAIKVYINIKDV